MTEPPGPGADRGWPARPLAPEPEPLPAPAFDSHCHLDFLDQPADDALAAAAAARITRVVTVGTDVASSRWAAACAAGSTAAASGGAGSTAAANGAPGRASVYAAVAIHPNETATAGITKREREAVLATLAALAAQPRVRAIGETGLDYYRDSAPPELQRDWFRAHIDLAKQSGRALMIHDRDAHADVLAMLAADGPPEQVIFHCFSGDAELAKRCAEAGYLLSFAGTVTFGNAGRLRDAAAAAPAELLLAETDAPFLTPVPNRGKANAPAQVAHTVRALAAIRGMDAAELCAILDENGQRVFGPWQDEGMDLPDTR